MDTRFFRSARIVRAPGNRTSTQMILIQTPVGDQLEHFHKEPPWCWAGPNEPQCCRVRGWVGKLPAKGRSVEITKAMTRKTTFVNRFAVLWLLAALATLCSRVLAAPIVSLAWDANTASDLA